MYNSYLSTCSLILSLFTFLPVTSRLYGEHFYSPERRKDSVKPCSRAVVADGSGNYKSLITSTFLVLNPSC